VFPWVGHYLETEEQKREYNRRYEEKEGIRLDYDKIKTNPGLRSFSKSV
jgi:hypothetical protein